MNPPVFCIYTSLFTLADRDPAQNQYIWIYLTWLWSLLNFGGLDFTSDRIVIHIDPDTHALLNKIEIHKVLLESSGSCISFYVHRRPTTLLEGFFNRHAPQFIEHLTRHRTCDQTIFLHMDIDTIFQKSLRSLPWPTVMPNTLFCGLEGVSIYSDCYLKPFFECCPVANEVTYYKEHLADYFTNAGGFTAGMFGFTYGDGVKSFFREIDILKSTTESTNKYYEQGCFNYVALKYHVIGNITLEFAPLSLREHVGANENKGEAILSLMGEAGDGNFHLEKVFGYLFSRVTSA